MSSSQAAAARASVLSFFKAPPEYTVIFTSNASGALKLVGEAYPFVEGSSYVLAEDSHNSVHGIRAFATRAGADARYIPSTAQGGVEEASARVWTISHLSGETISDADLVAALGFPSSFRFNTLPFRIHGAIQHIQLQKPTITDQIC